MCGRRSPKAPLELVELLAGAMGDGGGFQHHGNGHLVQGVGLELNQGFWGLKCFHQPNIIRGIKEISVVFVLEALKVASLVAVNT